MKSEFNFMHTSDWNEAKGKTVSDWLSLFARNDLTPVQLVQHWAFWIPKAFSPEQEFDSHEPVVNEEIFNTVLINTLEEFIFGNNEDFQKLFSDVSKLKSICGKIFKGGDPFYSCKDCGTDPTCVLCVSCFKMSEHKNHNYKIGASAGGGSCDCGDVLSWKSNPHCEVHLQGLENASGSLRFPEDLISRLELVITAVLHYCYDVLFLKSSSSLPSILKIGTEDLEFEEDYHCVVLYNDESHSFEEVASALVSVLQCTSIEAFSLATYVDKEGRAILKCYSHSKCCQLKTEMDRFTSAHNFQPLKVKIHDWCLVIHQIFSLKLLLWLENFTKQTQEFREVFTSIALNLRSRITNPSLILGTQSSVVQGVLCNDTSVWKAARLSWYHLFLSVMLVDQTNKLAFGKVFTSNYKAIVDNFISDDHDKIFSAASLSVQIFTVPAIAHHLIAYEDAISIMLKKFHTECIKLRNVSGKLDFTRGHFLFPFIRSCFVLRDLMFILNSPPEEWTSDLRKSFLSGISGLLDIFLLMEEMCGAKRQVGQHLEFEPEWKHEFKLQCKLTPVISHLLNWCSTDQIITLKAFKLILKKLYNYYAPSLNEGTLTTVTLKGHIMNCYDYNVLTQPVSIHLPLCRFFSGLYLNIQSYGFHFNSPEFNALIKPTPLQIIEPVLRTQVMIAQVYAGLWKRNGLSLQSQINYYQSVSCRTEMQDKDIILLQIGASLIESNKFLLNMLYKFNLIHWLSPDFESELSTLDDDAVKQTSTLIEEFLLLLLTIIGERYHPGIGNVTPEECLQNEILHKLFIKPCLHSELYSLLPDNSLYKIRIEQVIDSVATFQKPNSSQKGVYVVKKEFGNKYNPFFYHYNKEERSVSEDEQRKQRKALHGKEFCEPPCLPKLNLHFQPIACLLHSDVMLHIMRTVLVQSKLPTSVSTLYGQLQKILFLIGFALEDDQCYCTVKFTSVANEWKLKEHLEELATSKNVTMHEDLINFVLKRYKSYINGPEDCYQETPNKTDSSESGGKQLTYSKLAAERRAAIMAKMCALQQNFMSNNANLFTDLTSNKSYENAVDCKETEGSLSLASTNVCVDKTFTCIICQESQMLSKEGPAIVCAAFIQKSTVLHEKLRYCELLNFSTGTAVHVSTCGHFMHVKCWKDYIKIIYFEESRRPFRLRQLAAFDTLKNEYLCPLCKCLSNTILPIVPNCDVKLSKIPFSKWLLNLQYFNSSVSRVQETYASNLCHICSSPTTSQSGNTWSCPQHSVISESDCLKDLKTREEPYSNHLSDEAASVIESFISSLTILKEIRTPVKENFFLLWHSCVYTIQSFEKYLKLTGKQLFEGFSYRQETCLRNLVNFSLTFSILHKNKLIQYYQEIVFALLKPFETGWPDIFNMDCFNLLFLLVMTSFSFKDFDNSGKILLDKNVIIITILLNFAQVISLGDVNSAILDGEDIISEDTECLAEITKQFKKCRGVNTIELWNLLKCHSLPFLRCCAILYYFVSAQEPTGSLKEFGDDEYEYIMDYLGIAHKCQELFELPEVINIFEKWALHPIKAHQLLVNAYPCNLIELPHDYFELINGASTFTCPNRHRDDTRNPTMCLKCGELLCGDTYCCQKELNKVLVGSCTYHAHFCGAGNGIFLRLKECQVLLLSSDPSRGCFLPAPYFDEYGEPDQGLFRGDPLYLCESKYKDLQMLWLNHRIPEEISKSIESSFGFTSHQWNLM